MRTMKVFPRLLTVSALSALLAAGCFKYDVGSTVEADGSGMRSLRVILPEEFEEDWGMTLESFRPVFGVTEENGWSYEQAQLPPDPGLLIMSQRKQETIASSADLVTVHIFRRDIEIPDADSWAEQSGDIRIVGLLVGSTAAFVGVDTKVQDDKGNPYPTVTFENRIEMESGWYIDRPTRTYRETFSWEGLVSVLVENQMTHVRPDLDRLYPGLSPARRGELVGILKGGIWSSVEQGYFEMEDDERPRELAPLIDRLTRQCLGIVRVDHPKADETALRSLIREIIVEAEEVNEAKLEELPGVALAYNTEFTIRLEMEGDILETNAHERDGDTLVWSFVPLEAMAKPVEIYAQVHLKR